MGEPRYLLAMTAEQPNRVKNLFRLGSGTIAEVLENPGSFRDYGWDLQTLDQAHIENGEYLELNNGPRKQIQLYEDGSLLARGSIDESFLGWAPADRDFDKYPRVHSLAIIEFTAAFAYMYRKIVPFLERYPKQINFHVEIADGLVGERMLYIAPYPVETYGWYMSQGEYSLKNPNPQYEGSFPTQYLMDDPDQIAFQLVERLFLFFGVPANKIPYTREEQGVLKVNVDQIAKT
jgi:hypothetical protein